jgi:hypothetical protein
VTTNVYEAKAAFFDRLKFEAEQMNAFADLPGYDGISIAYAFLPEMGLWSIYGGGVRFEHRDAIAEGPGILVNEDAQFSVYIRVTARPRRPVEETDLAAELIGKRLAGMIRANPYMAGDAAHLSISGGQGDYGFETDESWSVLAYGVRVESRLSYG